MACTASLAGISGNSSFQLDSTTSWRLGWELAANGVELLRFCNSCQLRLHLHLSCDYLSNKLHSEMHNSCLPYYLRPSVLSDIPPRFPELLSSLILCHYYSVIISGYQLGLFTLHFNPRLSVSGYGHARNNLYYLSHAYSMSQKFLVVIFRVLVCLSQFGISTQLLQLVPRT